jgi:hypothetical protein
MRLHMLGEQESISDALHIALIEHINHLPDSLAPLHWEYRVLTIDTLKQLLPDEARLNELGHDGWLLIGVLDQRETGMVQFFFVRQSTDNGYY